MFEGPKIFGIFKVLHSIEDPLLFVLAPFIPILLQYLIFIPRREKSEERNERS